MLPLLTLLLACVPALAARTLLKRFRYNAAERRAAGVRWAELDGPWRVWLAETRIPRIRAQRLALTATGDHR